MGAFLEEVACSGEALVVCGAAFDGSGLGATGSVGEAVSGETYEQGMEKSLSPSRARIDGGQERGPLADGDDGALEGDAVEPDVVLRGGFEHEGADEVVPDAIHGQLLVNHRRGLAAKDVHAEGGLDVAQEEFGPPASTVEFDQGVPGKGLRIEQGGHDGDLLGSKPRHLDAEVDLAQREAIRHRPPDVMVEPLRPLADLCQ